MKKHLADTLKKLSREKDLEKISVGDIVKAGNVNRSTFYYYFKDKEDLIQYIFEDDIIGRYIPPEHDRKWIENIESRLKALDRDRPFYLQTLKLQGINNFQNALWGSSYHLGRCFIESYLAGRELDETSKDFIAAFYAHAAVAMSVVYVEEKAKEIPEEAAQRFFDVIESGMCDAIDIRLERLHRAKKANLQKMSISDAIFC